MNWRSILPKLLIAAVILPACRKVVDYPDTPAIEFMSLFSTDSTDVLGNPVKRVTLTFHLVDGNGDIGLGPKDTAGPFREDSLYYHNLFIREYSRDGGGFTAVPEPGGLKKYRLPDLTPSGQNKTLIADVSVTIEYPYSSSSPLPFNEFRYEFYLVDRALNLSNRDTSSVIVW